VRASRLLAVVDPATRWVEVSAWAEGELEDGARSALSAPWDPTTAYFGIDVADRVAAPAVVAVVAPDSPAAEAGVVPGRVLLRIGDEAASVALWDERRAEAEPGETLVIAMRAAAGGAAAEEVTVELTAQANVRSPNPVLLERQALLGRIAVATMRRSWGPPLQRVAATVQAGLLQAALGARRDAASTLDRATLSPEMDPSGDARATLTWVLEGLLRELGDPYAAEVGARLDALDEGRVGGREGVPLRLKGEGGAE
jgi:hypothetical protein